MHRIKYIVTVPLDEIGLRRREDQIPKELIHRGFEPKFVPVRLGLASPELTYSDQLLFDFAVYEEGLKAESEGYDAVCMDTVSDAGLNALRSRLRIPVVGPGIASLHLAGVLGHKFSIITMWDKWLSIYSKILREYHLEEKCASIRFINRAPDSVMLLEGKETETAKMIEKEALKAINIDNADVIVLGSTTMHQAHGYLSKHLPVPVLNPGLVAYKMAEMLIELNLSHSRKAFPKPESSFLVGPGRLVSIEKRDQLLHRIADAASPK
jgi:allantoin racemase